MIVLRLAIMIIGFVFFKNRLVPLSQYIGEFLRAALVFSALCYLPDAKPRLPVLLMQIIF